MKKLLLLFSIITLCFSAKAQFGMDFGIKLGGANYLGEIGGADDPRGSLLDMKFSQTNLAIGGFYRYSFTQNISAKLQVNFARIQGADSLSTSPPRVGRNLSFRTDIIDIMLTGEYAFFVMNDLNRRSRSRVDFSSYAFIGIGALMYYPHAQYNDKWYYLRPLQTEGTENAYDEMAIAVPFGLGANITLNKKFRIGFEAGYRFSFTDYLDDVSTDYAADTELPYLESFLFADRSGEVYAKGNTEGLPDPNYYGYNEKNQKGAIRGNPDTNDGYLLFQFNFSYVINSGNSFYKSRYGSIVNRKRKRRKF
tara:strand:+ start:1933 stop:2856 length:924 start_codon:yes stop_codon:yes gene_type:complete